MTEKQVEQKQEPIKVATKRDAAVDFKPQENELKINIKLDDLKRVLNESEAEPNKIVIRDDTEIRQAYEFFKEKFKDLPDYDELDDQFEISVLEVNKFFLRNLRRRMIEKIDFFSKILEIYLNPEPFYSISVEMQGMVDDVANGLNTIYKELMYFEKYSLEIAIDSDDEKEAKFIVELFEAWPNMKKELKVILKVAKDSWKKELKQDPRAKYFN